MLLADARPSVSGRVPLTLTLGPASLRSAGGGCEPRTALQAAGPSPRPPTQRLDCTLRAAATEPHGLPRGSDRKGSVAAHRVQTVAAWERLGRGGGAGGGGVAGGGGGAGSLITTRRKGCTFVFLFGVKAAFFFFFLHFPRHSLVVAGGTSWMHLRMCPVLCA